MPDRGLLEKEGIAAAVLDGARPGPWTLAGARWAQVTYEVGQQAALGRMPADVNRPIPCYARLFVVDAPESPVGPLRLAALLTGGRYRLLPKNVVTDIIIDGDAGAFGATFGGPVRPGTVSLRRDGTAVSAVVGDEGGELARVTLPAMYAIDSAMLRWDGWLGFAENDGVLQLVEYGPRPEPAEAFLAKGATLETPAVLPRNHLWHAYRNLNTISACYEEGTLVLSGVEAQQTIV